MTEYGPEYAPFLTHGKFVDGDHPTVIAFAKEHGIGENDLEIVLSLFYAIRDGIRYTPYLDMSDPASYRASDVVKTGLGWCVSKTALLAACTRIHGIPARPGFADVINHLATPKFLEALGCDIFYWHSYCDIYVDGNWVKATAAFNKSLCEKFGLKPLEFDGKTDSLFHEFDVAGNRHMQYIAERGTFEDIPFDEILATFKAEYKNYWGKGLDGDFEAEAAQLGAQ